MAMRPDQQSGDLYTYDWTDALPWNWGKAGSKLLLNALDKNGAGPKGNFDRGLAKSMMAISGNPVPFVNNQMGVAMDHGRDLSRQGAQRIADQTEAASAVSAPPQEQATPNAIQPNNGLPDVGKQWADDTRLEANKLWQNRGDAIQKLKFIRTNNPWDTKNSQYQSSIGQQAAEHADALANQMERMDQSAVMRNILPGSGINAENERAARFANAKSLGGALNAIEQDRYGKWANHETSQNTLENDWNRTTAQLKDAIGRGDAEAYTRLQGNLGDITGQQSSLQQQLQLMPGDTANQLKGQQYEGMQLDGGIKNWQHPASAALRDAAPQMAYDAEQWNQGFGKFKDAFGLITDVVGTGANIAAMANGMPPPLAQRQSGTSGVGQPRVPTIAPTAPGSQPLVPGGSTIAPRPGTGIPNARYGNMPTPVGFAPGAGMAYNPNIRRY